MPKRVTCQVCGQHFQALPSHLRKHGMSPVGAPSRDARTDRWCLENNWRYLRLTDETIARKPNLCRRVIHKFVSGEIVVLAL